MFDFGNANEGQRLAISTAAGPVLITAGPGTGKTFTLVQRAIYLIQECGVKPEQILMATFTEKAAKELVTRITNELSNRGIVVNINDMYIGTFHSLCLRIIKEHLEYTRLMRNYRTLDAFDQSYLVFQNINKFKSIPGVEDIFPKGSWKMAQEICVYVNNLMEELVEPEVLKEDEDKHIRAWDDASLMDNQRFKKLCRLPQLGVYVDEAHHLFGADLEKQIRAKTNDKTSLRATINMLAERTSIVACYNYTGTPYVNKQLLPEVVYAYGLKESIWNGYLKDADPIAFENVKSSEFLRMAVSTFWKRYGGKTYEGLNPKLAIYASGVEEAANEVRPMLETILSDLGIPTNTILINVGDSKYTKDEDIRNFNDLDIQGSQGNEKQFIILVEKGKEGWNCRSLFGVAMFRNPKSKIFVLQSTMRCLRNITDERLTATVFLSKENYDTLDDELHKNFNMEIKDIKAGNPQKKNSYKVRVLPPPRKIVLKKIWHEYSVNEKEYSIPLDFKVGEIDYSKYESVMYEKDSIARDTSLKQKNIDFIKEQKKYSAFSLTGEVARYLNISCILANKILCESADGIDTIVEAVNKHNEILDDVIIPEVFHALFDVTSKQKTEDKEVVLLREPKDAGYYEFQANDNLVLTNRYGGFTKEQIDKSFHADTYCFDSLPEKECFMQYITHNKIKEIYFTGMFTAKQGDLSVQYYDPESGRIRHYYPDFLAKLDDGSYQLIEVKGDNKIDDTVVKAKAAAAQEMAVASGVEYKMYSGSEIMKTHILDYLDGINRIVNYNDFVQSNHLSMVAEDSVPYGKKKE